MWKCVLLLLSKPKPQLLSTTVLPHLDPKLPLRLAGDVSSYGIGAVIAHVLPEGTERPI